MAKEKEEKPLSRVVAKIEYEQKFNLGSYNSETIKIVLEGPFEDMRDGKDLPRLMLYTAANMKRLVDKVHKNEINPNKYEQASEAGEVELNKSPQENKKQITAGEDDI